jgi:hypothetical protein
MGARALTGRSLTEIRLTEGVKDPVQLCVAQFIEELTLAATIEGHSWDRTTRDAR